MMTTLSGLQCDLCKKVLMFPEDQGDLGDWIEWGDGEHYCPDCSAVVGGEERQEASG